MWCLPKGGHEMMQCTQSVSNTLVALCIFPPPLPPPSGITLGASGHKDSICIASANNLATVQSRTPQRIPTGQRNSCLSATIKAGQRHLKSWGKGRNTSKELYRFFFYKKEFPQLFHLIHYYLGIVTMGPPGTYPIILTSVHWEDRKSVV